MRRWRTPTTIVAVAAVALVLVGATAVGRVLVADSATSASSSPLGPPPDGSRWVGMGDVVVAVPDWWTTGETQCLAPVEDTVYFDEAATADCADPASPETVREVSALAILDARKGYGELKVRDMRPAGTVDDHEVRALEGCEEWFEGVCRRMFAVPTKGVVFAVTIAEPGDGDHDAIFDSLRVLPDGLTTVPLVTSDGWTPAWGAEPAVAAALVDELEAAGLRVEVVTPEPRPGGDLAMSADLPEGSYLGAEPELGSVVEDGSTVTVTVMGAQP